MTNPLAIPTRCETCRAELTACASCETRYCATCDTNDVGRELNACAEVECATAEIDKLRRLNRDYLRWLNIARTALSRISDIDTAKGYAYAFGSAEGAARVALIESDHTRRARTLPVIAEVPLCDASRIYDAEVA